MLLSSRHSSVLPSLLVHVLRLMADREYFSLSLSRLLRCIRQRGTHFCYFVLTMAPKVNPTEMPSPPPLPPVLSTSRQGSSTSVASSSFSDLTKLEVRRQCREKCWFCESTPAEVAHVIPKDDPSVSSSLHDSEIFTYLPSIANILLSGIDRLLIREGAA